MRLREALALSINTVAAQLAYQVGPEAVVHTAKRMGINSPLAANPSIALGTSEVTLLELTGAYAPFANGGYAVLPFVIQRIRTPEGDVLFERTGSGLGRVASIENVALMNSMLQATVALAASFDMPVTAEGVETAEQAAFLHLCGCDQLQGYFFGRPMSEKAFAALLAPQIDLRSTG